MIDIKQYLEQTNTVLLTKDAFEYLKDCADIVTKIENDTAKIFGIPIEKLNEYEDAYQYYMKKNFGINENEEQDPCNTCGYEEGSIYCKEHCPHEAVNHQETVTEFADRCRECGKMRKGHWIFDDECKEHGHCSRCGYGSVDLVDGESHNFCRNCGAWMVEPQERSDKE